MKPEFTLTEAEIQSPLWKRLEAHMTERLTSLRVANDSDLVEMRTAKTRGRISMLKEMLSLGTPKVPIVPD